MRATNFAVSFFLLAVFAHAQVLPPAELLDTTLRELQQKYMGELKRITLAGAQHDFPYHFYYSRALDLNEAEQHRSDQRSVQFDHYHNQIVLKITGNYFASYSTELMKPEERARQTFQDVMLPLLEASIPVFATSSVPDALAFEVSRHIRKKILRVSSEGVENVVLILPKASALRMMAASTAEAKRAAAGEGQVFLNAEPIALFPGFAPVQVSQAPPRTESATPAAKFNASVNATVTKVESTEPTMSQRDSSPDALKNLQNTYQSSFDLMLHQLDSQAHFVDYAPPTFIPFHHGIYVQLSMTTVLGESATGSQYKLAALAFDQHIAHLIRPTLEYFKDNQDDLDGIDFSTSVRIADKESNAVAVEFVFPLNVLRIYKEFDRTGQQLIDSGFVLINEERVSLDLQIAEAGAPAR